MTERLQSLPEIRRRVIDELSAATQDRGHPWRTPVLATVADQAADARSVVLREFDPAHCCFLIYTDERAGKVKQLLRHPMGMLVMWSQQLGWQLRCRVHLSLESSGLAASSRWARIKLSPAAHDYLSPLPPGSPLAAPAEPEAPTRAALPRDYFSIISAQVLSIDWLELHEQGHRRARFEDGSACWLQP